MEKEKGLSFKPITDGLGFHPFSDGLPYAPVSKTHRTEPAEMPEYQPRPQQRDYSKGTGAVSAGAPRVAFPQPPVSRVNVPVHTPAPASALSKATTVARPAAQPSETVFPEARFGFFYMMKRSIAYILDTSLNFSLMAAALSAALVNQDINPELLMSNSVVFVSALFLIVFNWALITAQEIAFHTTVGKRVFRMALQGSTAAIFLRAFFFLPSVAFAGLGLLWAIFDSKRRCWHDLAVDVQPIEIARL